ncbi:hypothetical protein HMPREF0262_02986 [Clostridium sp. ATCC 29733]|nr:hypothetical protein HMPREF0262_02986 [Clostridium sp. ATCC 29733]
MRGRFLLFIIPLFVPFSKQRGGAGMTAVDFHCLFGGFRL